MEFCFGYFCLEKVGQSIMLYWDESRTMSLHPILSLRQSKAADVGMCLISVELLIHGSGISLVLDAFRAVPSHVWIANEMIFFARR